MEIYCCSESGKGLNEPPETFGTKENTLKRPLKPMEDAVPRCCQSVVGPEAQDQSTRPEQLGVPVTGIAQSMVNVKGFAQVLNEFR